MEAETRFITGGVDGATGGLPVVAGSDALALSGIASRLGLCPEPIRLLAGGPAALLRCVHQLRPRWIILDVPDGRDWEPACLRRDWPGARLAMLALLPETERERIPLWIEAGVRGVLLKHPALTPLLRPAIDVVAAGGTFIVAPTPGPEVFSSGAGFPPGSPFHRSMPLGEQDAQVLRLVAAGFSSKEIAARLGLATRAVEHRRTVIERTLGIKGTARLTSYALRHYPPLAPDEGVIPNSSDDR